MRLVDCRIDLSHNCIDEAAALVLASNLGYNSFLTSLDISHNPIGCKAARAFLRGLTLRNGQARPFPHLRHDWAHPCHTCTGTGLAPSNICTGTGRPLLPEPPRRETRQTERASVCVDLRGTG